MSVDSSGLVLHMRRGLPAPRARVFQELSDPAELAKWWGPRGFSAPSVELDLRIGGSYRIAMQPPDGDLFYLSGEFRTVEPPAELSYSFRWEDPDPDDRETVVTLKLMDLTEFTELSVTQGSFATEARRALHDEGWTDSLDRLEAVLRP